MADERPVQHDEQAAPDQGHVPGHGEPLRPGWSRPKPEHVPRPTYWPAVMALGITFLLWGLVTTYWISIVGAVLFAIALGGWIGEMRHDR